MIHLPLFADNLTGLSLSYLSKRGSCEPLPEDA